MKYTKQEWESYNKLQNKTNRRIMDVANILRDLELKYCSVEDLYRDRDDFTEDLEWEEETAKGENVTSIFVHQGDYGGDYARDDYRSVDFHTEFLWNEEALYEYVEIQEILRREKARKRLEEIKQTNDKQKEERYKTFLKLKEEFEKESE